MGREGVFYYGRASPIRFTDLPLWTRKQQVDVQRQVLGSCGCSPSAEHAWMLPAAGDSPWQPLSVAGRGSGARCPRPPPDSSARFAERLTVCRGRPLPSRSHGVSPRASACAQIPRQWFDGESAAAQTGKRTTRPSRHSAYVESPIGRAVCRLTAQPAIRAHSARSGCTCLFLNGCLMGQSWTALLGSVRD